MKEKVLSQEEIDPYVEVGETLRLVKEMEAQMIALQNPEGDTSAFSYTKVLQLERTPNGDLESLASMWKHASSATQDDKENKQDLSHDPLSILELRKLVQNQYVEMPLSISIVEGVAVILAYHTSPDRVLVVIFSSELLDTLTQVAVPLSVIRDRYRLDAEAVEKLVSKAFIPIEFVDGTGREDAKVLLLSMLL